jgi:hypothetical protein
VRLFSFPAGSIKDENCFNTRLLGLNKDVILLREIRVRNLNQFTAKNVFMNFIDTFETNIKMNYTKRFGSNRAVYTLLLG